MKKKYEIDYVGDTDKVRKLHRMAFGGDPWPGDDHEFWIAKDSSGSVAGFASMTFLSHGVVYLSRAAVTKAHEGNGLHRQMIRHRVRYAGEHGANLLITHVDKFNYASMMNLLDYGFRFAPREIVPSGWERYHVMYAGMDDYQPTESEIKSAIELMDDEIG